MSPIFPAPSGSKTIEQVLEEARRQLHRVTPKQLLDEIQSSDRPVRIIDIRPAAQRKLEGPFDIQSVHDSHFHAVHIIERNVLEWRLDPQCESRLKNVIDNDGYRTRIVVVCSEGYTSSLAAAALKELGLSEATDLVGGQKAWVKLLA